LSFNRKVRASTASVSSIWAMNSSQSWRLALMSTASKFFFTAVASKGVPSEKRTPWRKVKRYVLPSSEMVHDSARQGSTLPLAP